MINLGLPLKTDSIRSHWSKPNSGIPSWRPWTLLTYVLTFLKRKACQSSDNVFSHCNNQTPHYWRHSQHQLNLQLQHSPLIPFNTFHLFTSGQTVKIVLVNIIHNTYYQASFIPAVHALHVLHSPASHSTAQHLAEWKNMNCTIFFSTCNHRMDVLLY